MTEEDMEKVRISAAVQGLWLQYRELAFGSARARSGIENAAYTLTGPIRPEELPAPGAFMVAT